MKKRWLTLIFLLAALPACSAALQIQVEESRNDATACAQRQPRSLH